MENSLRSDYYGFASSFLAHEVDFITLRDLKKSDGLLATIGSDAKEWLEKSDEKEAIDQLSTDFSSLFLLYAQPIEASIRDNSKEIPTGMENPVMQFYMRHGFNLKLIDTHLNSPDHLAIELGFMQTLANDGDLEASKNFLETHLLPWATSYLLAQSASAMTPFYKDFCHFVAEFLVADYDYICEQLDA